MRSRPIFLSLLAVLVTSAFAGQGDTNKISIGSPAPALSVKKWLKGTPVTELDPNKTYVIEFWATWCGPCITSIPHVTKLAQENPDVTFLGVGIWEDDGPQLQAFVDKMGDKMGYNVAYSGNKEGMAASWMDAAGQNGIPSAFIVKGGKVVWVGHPMRMDKPLAEVKAGTYDEAAFKTAFEGSAAIAAKERAVQSALGQIDRDFRSGKRVEAKAALAKLVEQNPSAGSAGEMIQFTWLATEDLKAWETKAKAMASSKDDQKLMQVAGFALARAQKPSEVPLARKAIDIVLKAQPNHFMALQYGRAVYKKTGDDQLLLNVTKKLIAALPTSPAKDNVEFKETLEKERTELEAKVAKSGKN